MKVPDGATVSGGTFSPNGKRLAYLVHAKDGTFLHVADVKTGVAKRVAKSPLLATFVTSIRWTWDSRRLLVVLVPAKAGPMPQRDPIAREPSVWVTHAGKTASRTYRFLLKTPHDKALLEYLATGQLALLDAKSGECKEIGQPAMFTSIDVAPSSRYFRVRTMQKPFSYFVPTRSFGTKDELWDGSGKVVHLFSERKLRVGGSGRPDPRRAGGSAGKKADGEAPKRSLTWRPDGAGMSFLQRAPAPKKKAPKKAKADSKKADPKKGKAKAKQPDRKKRTAKKATAKKATAKKDAAKKKDRAKKGAKKPPGAEKGAAKKPADPRKDRVMLWLPPYSKKSVKVVWSSDHPIQSVGYSQDCRTLFITQTVAGKRRTFAVDVKTKKERKILESSVTTPPSGGTRGGRNRGRRRFRGAGGGGGLLSKAGTRGGRVVRTSRDRKSVYVGGADRPKGKKTGPTRAFVDRVTIGTAVKKRVWLAATDVAESLLTPTDDDFANVIVSRESATMVPNSYLLETASRKLTRLTDNVDPAPAVTAARRLRFQVERVDGFKFWVKVTIPRHYGARLPALFWFYPREFTSQKAYDARQRTPQPNKFPGLRTRSMEMLTLMGYVVVQPDCPIVGKEGRYERQLRRRASQQSVGGDRRTRPAPDHRPWSTGDRRSQLRCVWHRQRAGPHAVLQGGDRR